MMRSAMTLLGRNVRSTVQAAVGASRHLIWYVGYQIGRANPHEDD
jgi:hypothetical protein